MTRIAREMVSGERINQIAELKNEWNTKQEAFLTQKMRLTLSQIEEIRTGPYGKFDQRASKYLKPAQLKEYHAFRETTFKELRAKASDITRAIPPSVPIFPAQGSRPSPSPSPSPSP